MLDQTHLHHPDRRRFLAAAVASAGILALGGCRYYRPSEGAAYEPWDFPGDHDDPRLHLVHAALLAANPHNTQPWLFRLPEANVVELWVALERNIGAVDPLQREMYIGLGCALENLRLAADAIGRPVAVELLPEAELPELAARVRLGTAAPARSELYEAISTRHTNRGRYGDFSLDPRIADELHALVEEFTDVRLHLLTSRDDKAAFADLTVEATEAFIADAQMLADSDAWFRHTPEEILEHRDGVTLDAQSLGATTTFFAKSGQEVQGERGGRYWLRSTERVHTGPCSAFAILSTPGASRAEALRSGQAYQRLALWLEANGLASHPLSQSAELRDRELELGREPRFGTRLAALVDGRHAQMPFRLGYAMEPANPAPRRPVEWVVDAEGAMP